jgi:hypothetical protein
MFSLLDHLAAVLVGTTVIVILLALQHRGREHAVEATVHQVAQAQAHAFARLFERDVENMRTEAETRAALGTYACATSRDGAGRLASFTFPTLLDPDAGPASPVGHVTYRVEAPGDSVRVGTSSRALLRVVRETNDGSGPVVSGGSSAVVVGFDVALFPRRATAPTPACPDDLSRVRLEVLTAIAGPTRHADGTTPATPYNLARYGFTFRPLGREG